MVAMVSVEGVAVVEGLAEVSTDQLSRASLTVFSRWSEVFISGGKVTVKSIFFCVHPKWVAGRIVLAGFLFLPGVVSNVE